MRKFFAVALTAILTAASVFSTATGTAYAGEQLGQTNFDDGVGLPWHTCESEPGKMEFEIKDGKYQIKIINPGGRDRGGEDRWDCQFRHRGLSIVSGHQYRVQYEITASNSGKYYTKIGNLDGDVEVWHNMSNGYDLDNTWDPIWIGANETKRVTVTFTATRTIEVAEWAFHLGGAGQYTNGDCFPIGTIVTFDNMSLVDLSGNEHDYVAEESWTRQDILVNQLGYFKNLAKRATLLSDSKTPIEFYLLDEAGNKVYTGMTEPFGYDDDSQDKVHTLDFSDFNKTGTYKIQTKNGAVSKEIHIGNTDTYSALVRDSLNYFYQNRSGIKIESGYVTSGDAGSLKRDAGHKPDVATIEQIWGYSGTSGTQDVTGGWYDAGDHGKYVVNGGVSLWIMQNQYEMAKYLGYEDLYADGSLNIPENKNTYPDILDEARWELEWMFKMLVKSGSCENMVYHKVHDAKWTGLGIAPSEDPQNRVIKPPTTAATLNVAACAAQAARLWAGIDDAFADQCLEIAKKTYEAAKAHPAMYAPMNESIGGGAYGDDNVEDEFYWAASELYITTLDNKYLSDMKDSKFYTLVQTSLGSGEAVNTVGTFDWGNVAALGNLSLAICDDFADQAKVATAIKSAADYYIGREEKQGYGLPYGQSTISYDIDATGYVWGSNSFVADNALIMGYAYALTAKTKYLDGLMGGLDYLLGRNAMDQSYVTGYGYHTTQYPHHRFWANLIEKKYPLAPAGVLSGGPNSGLQDPWVKGLGWAVGAAAPQKCYVDHIEAWSVNECTINWNAPLAWITAFVTMTQDEDMLMNTLSFARGQGVKPEIEQPTKPDDRPAVKPTEAVPEATKPQEDSEIVKPTKPSKNEEVSEETMEQEKPTKATKPAKEEKEDKDDDSSESNQTILWIVIIIAALLALMSTEFFIYKMMTSKKKD